MGGKEEHKARKHTREPEFLGVREGVHTHMYTHILSSSGLLVEGSLKPRTFHII